MKQGPNVTKLIKAAEKWAAWDWVQSAIRAVRAAAEPNPWKNADDETIAAELLEQIEPKNVRRPKQPEPQEAPAP